MANPRGRRAAMENGAGSGVLSSHDQPARRGPKHEEVQEELLILRKGFWKNAEARKSFRAVVADIEKINRVPRRRMKSAHAPVQMMEVQEVKYQWCVVDGVGFWCKCETVMIGGVPKLICTEV